MPTLNQNPALDERGIIAVAANPTKCDFDFMGDPRNACSFDKEVGFEAMKLFLEAYWERGGRTSDDLAVLLGSLDIDPAQRSDWAAAIRRALPVER